MIDLFIARDYNYEAGFEFKVMCSTSSITLNAGVVEVFAVTLPHAVFSSMTFMQK